MPYVTFAAASRCGNSPSPWSTAPTRLRHGGTLIPRSVSSSTVFPTATYPRGGTRNPAMHCSVIVFPAPEGPNSTVRWCCERNATSSVKSPRRHAAATVSTPCSLPPPDGSAGARRGAHRHQGRDSEEGEDRRNRQRRAQPLRAELDEQVDRQRIRMVRQHHGGAELTQRAEPDERQSGEDAGPRQRQRDAEERRQRWYPERVRDALERGIDAGERDLRGHDEKRGGHENLGQDDAGPCVRDSDISGVEPPADQPVRTEYRQEQQAAGQRRHDERK